MKTKSPRMEKRPATSETAVKPPVAKVSVQTSLAPSAPTPSRRPLYICLSAATVSGILLWACYQPLAFGSYLGWVALVPFLVLVRSHAKPRFIYGSAYGCGVVFFVSSLYWMSVADQMMIGAWLALSVYCALYFPAALFCIRCLERWRLPLLVTVPLVWAALEYLRSFFMTGFAWYFLAHTQHDVLPMIQIADFGGVYAVTFLVAAVNAFLFDCAYQFPEVRGWFQQTELEPYRCYSKLEILNWGFLSDWLFRRNLMLEGAALAFLLLGAYLYGDYRLHETRFTAGPTVCLLQSNLDQRIRNNATKPENDGHDAKTVTEQFVGLCVRAIHHHKPPPDLIIWPETSYPREWFAVSPKLPIERVPQIWRAPVIDIQDNLRELVEKQKASIPHLLGMNTNFLDENAHHRRYNSALFLNPTGRVEARFDKMHRVPFGEYVPFKDWLPFMKSLSPYDFDYSIQPGEQFTRFKIARPDSTKADKHHHFGVLVCFEDTDPLLARRYLETSDDGPPVDFLVNISNDGWFDGSTQHAEHLAVSRFRAIECRRAIVRSVNMGISALIDSNGRVLKPALASKVQPPVWVVSANSGVLPVSEWHHYTKVSGVLTAQVPIDGRFSLYPIVGDWLPIGCWMLLFAGASWAYIQRKRQAKRPLAV